MLVLVSIWYIGKFLAGSGAEDIAPVGGVAVVVRVMTVLGARAWFFHL